ncbi:MAG: NAD(P)/FAD-dependent oxidoreductase [Spirochaetia bacterium]|jgi:glycerol-3-phosphate dehydrogenase
MANERAPAAAPPYDVIIIGAGVVGCAVARELSAYDLSIAVVEKGSYLCAGQSKGNGAIIHGGHDPKPGTLKATLNVEGNWAFPGLCASLGVTWLQTGIYVIAFDERERGILEDLHKRAWRNGVPGAAIIDAETIRRTEPNVSRDALAALSLPSGGIVDVFRLVIAMAEQAAINGVTFLFDHEVTGLPVENGAVTGVATSRGTLRAALVVNCAGVNADQVMGMAGISDFKITPCRGEYYVLDSDYGWYVSRPVFQIPLPSGKGILIFPSVHGNMIIGGDSAVIGDRADTSTTAEGFEIVRRHVLRLVPGLDVSRIIGSFSGVRASGSREDFLIEAHREVRGLVNAAGIASPGLTAAPAIAGRVRDLVGGLIDLKRRSGGLKEYRLRPLFRDLPENEKEAALRRNSAFGNVVCRCEYVTEGDIVDALHAPLPARTLDAVKIRTRTGTGRCQGAFDLSRILQVMSRELRIPAADIRKNGPLSTVVIGETRGGASHG